MLLPSLSQLAGFVKVVEVIQLQKLILETAIADLYVTVLSGRGDVQ